MAKVYLISCRDAGVDCDFQARGSGLEEVMQLCADHGIQEHNIDPAPPDAQNARRRPTPGAPPMGPANSAALTRALATSSLCTSAE